MGQDSPLPRLDARSRPLSDPLRLMLLLGTRPEAIKMAPLALAARNRGVETRLVSSGQHPKEMLEVLDYFGIPVDIELDLFRKGRSLIDVLKEGIAGFHAQIAAWSPDVVVVQGDTTSTLAGGLAAFYAATPVAHLEAGLRSHNLAQPYPEEVNRLLVDAFASFLFAPTPAAAANLAAEGINGGKVFVTGNTVVDSLFAIARDAKPVEADEAPLRAFFEPNGYKGRVLITCHRRESWGNGLDAVAAGLARAARRFPDYLFLAPLHPNPAVRRSFNGGLPKNVLVGDPLPYSIFVKALAASDLVVTDSGGVLEEATCLAKRVVVVRSYTERPEALASGKASVVGVESEAVESAIALALTGASGYERTPGVCVFGDGQAGERVIGWLLWHFGLAGRRPAPFTP